MSRQAGYIYILKHQNGQTVKVGETSVSPQSRLEGYSEAYQLQGFSIYKTFKVPLNSRQDIEKRTHAKLKQDRLSGIAGAREIFACTPHKAETAVEEAISESKVYLEELNKQIEQEKVRKEKERIKIERENLFEDYINIKSKEWDLSNEKKKLDIKINEFLENNPIKIKKMRPIWHYCLIIIFSLYALASILTLINMPFYGKTNDYWMIPWILLLLYFSIQFARSIFETEPGMKDHVKNKTRYNQIMDDLEQHRNQFLDLETKDFEKFYLKNRKVF